MDSLILQGPIIINDENLGDFIYISNIDVDPISGTSTANINISNTSMYFSISITNDDIKQSVTEFFNVTTTKDQNG